MTDYFKMSPYFRVPLFKHLVKKLTNEQAKSKKVGK